MSKLKIIILKGPEKFGAFVEGKQIYIQGSNIEELKSDILDAIELYKNNTEEIPGDIAGEYEIEYHFDTPSFLRYFAGTFSKAALERMTGINQKLLGHYASGLKKPRASQVKKIDNAIKKIVEELSQVHITS